MKLAGPPWTSSACCTTVVTVVACDDGPPKLFLGGPVNSALGTRLVVASGSRLRPSMRAAGIWAEGPLGGKRKEGTNTCIHDPLNHVTVVTLRFTRGSFGRARRQAPARASGLENLASLASCGKSRRLVSTFLSCSSVSLPVASRLTFIVQIL